MRRHVDRELARARIPTDAAQAQAHPAPVVARLVQDGPAGAGLEWQVDLPQAVAMRIDPDDLTEALGTLLENAARHARLRVQVGMRADGDRVAVVIGDDRPGVPDAELARLAQRDVRMDQGGDSHGIGLAIVTDIAEAAGGHLMMTNIAPGLSAELHLPRHPD